MLTHFRFTSSGGVRAPFNEFSGSPRSNSVVLFPERRPSGPGISILPIPTPLLGNGEPVTDPAILRPFLQHAKHLGASRIFLLGETGEFRFLTKTQRASFIEAILPIAQELGIRVCLNVTYQNNDDTKDDTKEEIQRFQDRPEVDAIILTPMLGNNLQILQAIYRKEIILNKPLVIYLNPGITEIKETPTEVLLLGRGYIQAFKDSTGSIEDGLTIRRIAKNIGAHYFVGSEKLISHHLNSDEQELAPPLGAVPSNNILMFQPALTAETAQERAAAQVIMDKVTAKLTMGGRYNVAAVKNGLYALGLIPDPRLANGNSHATPSPEDSLMMRRLAVALNEVNFDASRLDPDLYRI